MTSEKNQPNATSVQSAFASYLSIVEKNKSKETDLDDFFSILLDRIETVEWLGNYAYCFPDWIKIIGACITSEIEERNKNRLSIDREMEALREMSFFFSKMLFCKGVFYDWWDELDTLKKELESVIE